MNRFVQRRMFCDVVGRCTIYSLQRNDNLIVAFVIMRSIRLDDLLLRLLITTMIVSFGGSVQSRISKNIRKYTLNNIATIIVVYLSLLTFTFAMSDDVDYLLAGRGVSSDKIKTATNEKNKATVINLPRLQKLLLGQLTLDNLKEMDKLTSKSFSKKNYVRAEVLQSSMQNATTNN